VLSDYAPRMITIKINPEKIRDVIGKGGSVIRALTEETGTTTRYFGRRRRHHRQHQQRRDGRAKKRIENITAGSRSGSGLRRHCAQAAGLRADRDIRRARTVCCTSPKSPTSVSKDINDYLKDRPASEVKVIQTDEKGPRAFCRPRRC